MSTLNLLPHNERAYNSISMRFRNKFKTVLYVAGTGTGKTYVVDTLLRNIWRDKRVAYVVPTHAIWDYLSSVLDPNADVAMFTYKSFLNDEIISDLKLNYDVVIFDEAHHLGSNIIGKTAVQFMSEFSGVTFGITATPVREDGIDVSQFFEQTIYGPTNFQAIKNGLMPQFEYFICSTYDAARVINEYKLSIDLPSSAELVTQVITTHSIHKMLAFYSTISDMEAGISELSTLFPNYKVVSLSHLTDDIKKTLAVLNEDNVILASCDMLLEGLHVPSVDAILLFRNVQSTVVLQQILGRVSSIGSHKNPVVMDFTSAAFKLFEKIMSEDYGIQRTHSGASRNSRSTKPLLKVPISGIKAYDIMTMLAALQGGPVYVLGRDFNSIRAACRYYGISMKKLLRVIDSSVSLDDAFSSVLQHKIHIGEHSYETINSACSAFNVSPQVLRQASGKCNVPIPLMLEDFVEFPIVIENTTYHNPRDIANEFHLPLVRVFVNRYVCGSYRNLILESQPKDGFTIFDQHYDNLSQFCRPLKLKVSDITAIAESEGLSMCKAAEELCRRTRIVVFGKPFLSAQLMQQKLNITFLTKRYFGSYGTYENLVGLCLDPKGLRKQPITYDGVWYSDLDALCKDRKLCVLDVLMTCHNGGLTLLESVDTVLGGKPITQWCYGSKEYKSLYSMLWDEGLNTYVFERKLLTSNCTVREVLDSMMGCTKNK